MVKGGRRFSFTALVVIGDEVDRVGVGYGKAREVPLAISKAVDDAKKNLFTVPKHGRRSRTRSLGRVRRRARVLRPACEGTGVIAGGGVRAVLELGGIRDILAKCLGTTNPINMLKATVDGAAAAAPPRGRRARRAARRSPRCCRCEGAPQPRPPDGRRAPRPSAEEPPLRRPVSEAEDHPGAEHRSARPQQHRGTLRALGLGKIGQSAEHEDSPAARRYAPEGRHLVEVEEA